jgi:hypothetical protein
MSIPRFSLDESRGHSNPRGNVLLATIGLRKGLQLCLNRRTKHASQKSGVKYAVKYAVKVVVTMVTVVVEQCEKLIPHSIKKAWFF